jgi:hypothetical protein
VVARTLLLAGEYSRPFGANKGATKRRSLWRRWQRNGLRRDRRRWGARPSVLPRQNPELARMPHTDSIELVGSIVVARMAGIGATSSLGRFLVKDRSPPNPPDSERRL